MGALNQKLAYWLTDLLNDFNLFRFIFLGSEEYYKFNMYI